MKTYLFYLVLVPCALQLVCSFVVARKRCRRAVSCRQDKTPLPLYSGLIDSSFDFSSPRGWDAYYRQDVSSQTLEWHSSIPLSIQIGLVRRGSSCLVVGCGNSAFPQALYHAHDGETLVTCLDSSSTCIDQLRNLCSEACPNMMFVCGDAIRLSETLLQVSSQSNQQAKPIAPLQYDVIMDKGLTDAILCGEGWDGPLRRLVTEASSVLTSGGRYVLICYRLSTATQQFLDEVGNEMGLTWSFNVNGTTDRVSISIATKDV